MAEVLVLAEHADGGEVKKVTVELLTAARRLGSPSVVWDGPRADAARDRRAEVGAVKVYVADSADFADFVGAFGLVERAPAIAHLEFDIVLGLFDAPGGAVARNSCRSSSRRCCRGCSRSACA